MSRLNGKGPQGAGPQTGRGLGNCSTEKTNLPYFNTGRRIGNCHGKGNKCARGYSYNRCFQPKELTPEE